MKLPRTSIFLMMLPGIAFWIHLILWAKGWEIVGGAGENWWPLIIQYGLLLLSAIFALIGLCAGVVAIIRKRESLYWWVVALVNLGPVLFVLLFLGLSTLNRYWPS